MPTDPATLNTMANFAKGVELRVKVAKSKAKIDAMASLAQSMASLGVDENRTLELAQAELAALESGAGPGITDDFGYYTLTDQALRAERFAGKAAWVDFVKANPTCTEADALPAYTKTALAARPVDRQWLLHDPSGLRKEYTAELKKRGYILDTTWESWRAFILATPRETLLSMS